MAKCSPEMVAAMLTCDVHKGDHVTDAAAAHGKWSRERKQNKNVGDERNRWRTEAEKYIERFQLHGNIKNIQMAFFNRKIKKEIKQN